MIGQDEVRALLRARGWKQHRLASEAGVTQATVSRWLSGSTPDTPQQEILRKLISDAGLNDEGDFEGREVAVVGVISAGGTIEVAAEDVSAAIPLYEIMVPFGVPSDAFALQVRGESMWPRYDDGDVIICYRQSQDPAPLIGFEAAVGTADGNRYLKRLMPSDRPGLYNLESHNAGPIRNVTVSWVSEVFGLVRAERWRRLDEKSRRRQIRRAAV